MRRNKGKEEGRARVLAQDACPSCGALMRRGQGTFRFPVNSEHVPLPGASLLRCPKCHETMLSLPEARKLRLRAFELYRQRHGLLLPAEIRSIRQRLGLSPAALARLLRQRREIVSRWEAGGSVQIPGLDALLRLVRDVPGSLAYLRRMAA